MDHQPPPFFKRGPAPLALLSFYVAISLALLLIDARLQALEVLRQAISAFTEPVQQLAHLPAQFLDNAGNYFVSVSRLQDENAQLKRARLENVAQLLRTQQLEVENERLRRLLGVKQRQQASGQLAQILYSVRDPYSRRIVIDKGQQDKVVTGQPVIDDVGIVGQVTRVFPFVSEVTLITDKEQAVPVQIVRTGLRSVVFGLGNGQLELRYLPANADVHDGDVLVTSGLDGIFLPGFPVAKVAHIERDTSYSFARIFCVPLAGVENFSEVMILDPRPAVALPEQLAKVAAARDAKSSARSGLTKKKRLKKD
ncbi:MAG TPA: rod shape-determining protein MreC [Accumulibacter sp.]|uniref:rod shape-determining protein MreC n=1 Tax=Accumulibacter sp. TaxID=2053492 RepID=UPI0025FD241E|nr:rod shape-determining protein MreC [Accumulibacter sp.]MCM8598208.1 rod shape-determining protein MreC [Accumulibacter sp.]MCM8662695.1 rod shape-determining protein MreC [Accumulibacter sp.]HNC52778.1 rod shape-determining protein MreC [Accumulibacter sp.]